MNKKCDAQGHDIQTRVMKALLEYPHGATGAEIGIVIKQYADTVRHACARLTTRGLVVRQATRPISYVLTELGRDVALGKAKPPRKEAVVEDNWKPKPWIHPIRARALGLPVAGGHRATA